MEYVVDQTSESVSATELITTLFEKILGDAEKFDPEVVILAKSHLGVSSPHSKAANNLADALIELAKKRAATGTK